MRDEISKPAYRIAAGWGLTSARDVVLGTDGSPVGELTDLPAPSSVMMSALSSGLVYEFAVPPTWKIVSGAASVIWELKPRSRKEWRRWLRFFFGGKMPSRHVLHNIERREARVRRRTDRGF